MDSHSPDLNEVVFAGEQIAQAHRGKFARQATEELVKARSRWSDITDNLAKNQKRLEAALHDWQEYTGLMENMMLWLREKDKSVRSPSRASSVPALERELQALKVTSL